MEFCRSAILFAWRVVRRFYVWLPAVVLDPFDLNEKLIQPMLPEALKFNLPWPPDWSGAVLLLLLGLAAIWTFHEARLLALKDDIQPTDSVRWLFRHMLTDSDWAIGKSVNFNDQHKSGGKLYHDLQTELRDAARLGVLKVWARPQSGAGWKPPLSEIKPSQWSDMQFDLPTCMGVGETAAINDCHTVRPTQLEDARINRRQVLARWPRATLWQRLRDKARKDRVAFFNKECSDQMNVAW